VAAAVARRIGKVLGILAGIFAILVFALWIFSHVNRPKSVKAFYRFEARWNERWPLIQNVEPFLYRTGFLAPTRIQVERGVSFHLDPRDLVPITILRTGVWQPEIWNSLAPSLPPGAVFLDVGAHIGYFSIKAAVRVGKTGRVVAFEPNPGTLKELNDNVKANRTENVIVEPIACTDREQMLTLYAAPELNTGASSLSRENASVSVDEAPRAYAVRGRPIDDVVRELNLTRVDAIKIDVEGAELSVLRGTLDTLRRFHPKLVIEVIASQLATFHTTPDEVVSLIKSAGYTLGRPLNPEEHDWEWTYQAPRSLVQMSDVTASAQLIRGFQNIEQNAWRWTGRKFTVALQPPAGTNKTGGQLVFQFHIPDASIQQLHSITISAKIGDSALAPETFSTPGKHEYRRDVPASILSQGLVTVDFSVDKVLTTNGVEYGVVATAVGLEAK
jgi:FkbM family methyltransferase